MALLGRVADPVRPYLVSKKTGLSLSSQIAVYIVERLFDAGAMALIFSSVILLRSGRERCPTPRAVQESRLRGHGWHHRARRGSFWLPCAWPADVVASFLEGTFGLISKKLGHAVGEKIRTFHAGLDTMRSFSDFGVAAALSLGMWMVIALAYLETTRAFVASPQLASMTLAQCMLLMAVQRWRPALPTACAGLVLADRPRGRGHVQLLRRGAGGRPPPAQPRCCWSPSWASCPWA